MRHEYYLNVEQVRILPAKGTNWEKIFKYAKLMENGVKFPPVKIFFNSKTNKWSYNDGRNRVMAAKLTKLPLKVRSFKRMGLEKDRM